MRIKTLIVIFFAATVSTLAAEKPEYAVDKIPAALKAKANAVVRESQTTITILSNGSAEERCKTVVTILNENAERFSTIAEYYDKFSSLSDLEGAVYDQTGKRIEKLSGKFIDVSAISGFSLYEDNRVKLAQTKNVNYPITIEFSYTKKHKGYFVLPGFLVYPGYNVAVESASFTLIEPVDADGQGVTKFYANKYFTLKPTEIKEENNVRRTWNASMLPALEEEPLSQGFTETTPYLMVAPTNFSIGGTTGSNKSWNDIATWSGNLIQGLDSLTQSTHDLVKNLTVNATSDFEKAKILYEYMQQKVRYVSIQDGLGGWKPFPAETVDRLSYGDCKALSNYMKSLLNIVRIKSYYVRVKAGSDAANIKSDFICSQFNHVIIMIPSEKDTLFLECTSQQNPFGYNGSFTDDRDVLVVEGPNGGYLKHTNIYDGEKNKTQTKTTISLDWNLNGKFVQKTKYTGVATDNIRFLMLAKTDRQKEFLQRKNNISQLKIDNFNFNENKAVLPTIDEVIEGETAQFSQYANKSSVTIPFNLVATVDGRFKRSANRRSDIFIKRDEIVADTICYSIPSNYRITNAPKPTKVDSKFGSYDLQVNISSNKVEFIRVFKWKKGTFAPELYQELYQFITNVNELDKQIILLSRT